MGRRGGVRPRAVLDPPMCLLLNKNAQGQFSIRSEKCRLLFILPFHLQLVPWVVKHVQPSSRATHVTQDTRILSTDRIQNAKVSEYLSFSR